MTMLLLERDADVQLWDEDGGGATLDDLLSGAWEGLTAAVPSTACPVCQGELQPRWSAGAGVVGELQPRWSAGAGVVGGRCRDCGSELS